MVIFYTIENRIYVLVCTQLKVMCVNVISMNIKFTRICICNGFVIGGLVFFINIWGWMT